MRAFIYSRFSSRNQQEISIEGQVRECRKYADQHGIEVLGEYADRARSGRTENRADFRRLMRDVESHVVDCVLVWKMDRFFRNRAESALYRMQLNENHVQLISVTEFIPDGSAGIITQGMIETVSEYFSAKLSEDVTRGMYDTAKQCRITCAVPLGYKSGDDHKYHIDPIGAEAVQRIFHGYDSGMRLKDIAAKLNTDGFRTSTGCQFNVSGFNRILRNEKYIGIYRYGDEIEIKDGCPRIIDDDLFFRVQRRLSLNKHRPGAYKADVDYMLSGKLYCGLCGTLMAGISGTSHSGAKHYYYSCGGHRRHKCAKKNVPKDIIEQAVLDSVIGILTDENIAYISSEVEKHCAIASESMALLSSLKAQLATVQAQITNIGKAISAGIITETTKDMLEAAEADRAALRVQIDKAKVQASLTVKSDQVACWLDGFRHGSRDDPDFQHQVFGALVHSVFVYEDHLKIIFNIDKHGASIVPFSALSGSHIKQCGSPS